MELVLKLGTTTGEPGFSEERAHSPLARSRGPTEHTDRRHSEADWTASLRIAVYLVGKELTMKKKIQKFHIANALLWAAAIIAAALMQAPITLITAVLPSLAGCSLFIAEYLLNRAE